MEGERRSLIEELSQARVDVSRIHLRPMTVPARPGPCGLRRDLRFVLKHLLQVFLTDVSPRTPLDDGKLAQPIRVAVSGTTVSQQIIDTLILLDRERTIARIKSCSTQCES